MNVELIPNAILLVFASFKKSRLAMLKETALVYKTPSNTCSDTACTPNPKRLFLS